ncbi:hypothetical protein ACFQZ4_01190 [Catellatospora coxensis]|uniref:Uncharacterized protein n=1 Tax=Catellatospora coxensis TaxID=310354 RepID=A0A8J3L9X6_9ACTN|nr:hypothetical protein [Catellatospora coxensis]GIG11196.1 hypothetical protein Cco03nite_78960 [Catellatospora coxensis]
MRRSSRISTARAAPAGNARSAEFGGGSGKQLLAYCTALKVSTAWLVYAEGATSRAHQVRNSSFRIVHYPLDLSASPRDLLAQVAELASKAMEPRGSLTDPRD